MVERRAWWGLGVLFAVYTLNYLDRSLIYILFKPIRAELSLTELQLALLGSTAFVLFYTVLGVPFGRLADRMPRTWMIAAGLVLWSAASAGTGLAGSFATLFLCRMIVGVGEATLGPALGRLREYPVESLGQRSNRELGVGAHAEAVVEFAEVASTLPPNSGDATLTKIEVSEHIVQVAQHVSRSFGYQQWFLFDDRWAAAHPGLARSLLRYGMSWDPLGGGAEDEDEP